MSDLWQGLYGCLPEPIGGTFALWAIQAYCQPLDMMECKKAHTNSLMYFLSCSKNKTHIYIYILLDCLYLCISMMPGQPLVAGSNLLIARFSLIIILCVATSSSGQCLECIKFDQPWLHGLSKKEFWQHTCCPKLVPMQLHLTVS